MTIFKAYDIRGVYPSQLNEETAYNLGRAFVSFLNCKTVVIGRDMRLSSPSLFDALAKGITEQGADVIDIGLAITPMMYFTVKEFKYDSGIIITASHNPSEYNGFKLVTKEAFPVYGEEIQKIKEIIENGKFKAANKKGRIIKKDILHDYISSQLGFIDAAKLKNLRIVIDAGNGMGGLVFPKFFEKINVGIIPMYLEMDGTFPNHQPDPLEPKNLEDIRKKIKDEKANLGIAVDGDCDRIMFIDENADIVPADFITTLVAKAILKEKPNSAILYDLRSSMIVKELIEKNKGNAVMCRVGHSFIKKQMRDENAVFAGELSGHYYFKDVGYFEAPLLAVLYILKLMTEENKPLSEIIAPLRKYYATGEINFEVKDKKAKMNELVEKYEKQANNVSYLDGIRLDFDDFWFNVRPSNTEPLLRLNLEAKTKELMEKKKKELVWDISKN